MKMKFFLIGGMNNDYQSQTDWYYSTINRQWKKMGSGSILFNTLHKFNTTCNQWKYVSGNYSIFRNWERILREYSINNQIGARRDHRI